MRPWYDPGMVASKGYAPGPPLRRPAFGAHRRLLHPARGSGGGCLTFSQIAMRFAPPGLAPATFSCKKSSRTDNFHQLIRRLSRMAPPIPENACHSQVPVAGKRLMPLKADYGRDLKLTDGSGCGMVDRVINEPGGRPMRPFPEKTGSPSVSVSEAPATPTGS